MTARLLRLLVLLALTLMPLRMVGIAPAMATQHAPEASATGHCADMPAPADSSAPPRIDCMMACATLPAVSIVFEAAAAPAVPTHPAPIVFEAGIAPVADPPPPRFS